MSQVIEYRDLKALLPQTLATRPLIGQYIDYVMNNFFQPVAEEFVSGYIGKRNIAFSRDDYYLPETTGERDFYALDPMITTETTTGDIVNSCDYLDMLGYLSLQNANLDNHNKLFSANYWSWSPPINPDMLVNYIYYFWIPEGPNTIILNEQTNMVTDVIGKKSYTYTYYDEDDEELKLEFKSGMKIKLINDMNIEYNNKCYLIEGVGQSIQLIEEPEEGYPELSTPEYYVMERGCKDGNYWSSKNRWFHKSVLQTFDFGKRTYTQAKRPIIGFIKDLQLYNYGQVSRGNVDVVYDGSKNDIEGKSYMVIDGVRLEDGTKILITGEDISTDNNCIYVVSGLASIGMIVLQKLINGSDPNGQPMKGEGVYITDSSRKGEYIYYTGKTWVEGQRKEEKNQSPLFELYDINGESLRNYGIYPSSTFKGSRIFDYHLDDSEGAPIDSYIGKPIIKYDAENYPFDVVIKTEKFYYISYNETKTIDGYKFYKLNSDSGTVFGTVWQLNSNLSCQYISHEEKVSKIAKTTNGKTYFDLPNEFTLRYIPDDSDTLKTLEVYHNGDVLNEGANYTYENGVITLGANVNLEENDYIMTKVYKPSLDEPLDNGYYYDIPVQLSANPMNNDIDYISYNELLEHFRTIILNQLSFTGNPLGINNYNDTEKELFRGTEIIQNEAPLSKTMMLNLYENTNIQNVIEFAKSKYVEFKNRFKTVMNNLASSGAIDDQTDETEACQMILDTINIGKEGLFAFYNNGVSTFKNAYIPATPAFLGMDRCYIPSITTLNNSRVLECHDGSLDTLFNDFRDNILLTLEQNIYESILNKFKTGIPVFNPLKYIPGKFRKTDFTVKEFNQFLEPVFDKWCLDNNIDYKTNTTFSSDDMNTWNWSSCIDQDGEQLAGNIRGVLLYYYDTVRPHTHPWEMLGFGGKPSWWVRHYGNAPYTSENIPMWSDIENGYIADGPSKGYYEELKREGLVEKYIPVDANGNLKTLMDIGITTSVPNLYNARQNWKFGDCSRFEYIWRLTPNFKFDLQNALYLNKPALWLEKNWDTKNYNEIYRGTSYFQVYNSLLNDKLTPKDTYLHNEYIDNKYIQNIGVQQWFSDKIVNENNNITDYIGTKIRMMNARIGYKCGSYYKTDSVKIMSDSYGLLPDDNYKIKLHKSLTKDLYTYSAMQITMTDNGFRISGFDDTHPYFLVKDPETSGNKGSYTFDNISVIHYNTYKNRYVKIKYDTVINNIQQVYSIIQGYGEYLRDNGWLFNITDENGEPIDWLSASRNFIKWCASKPNTGIVLLLNPGYTYLGLTHLGVVDKVGKMVNGFWTALDCDKKPIENKDLFVQRQLDNTFVTSRANAICCLRLNIVQFEHTIMFDNKTIFNQILYVPTINARLKRFKLFGIRAKSWTGSLFAPGYIINDTGATANFDKLAGDFKYFYDVDNVHAQGKFTDQAKKLIGYKDYEYMENLLVDDRAMFDFYKGYLKEKGTPLSFNKLSKSKYIMETDKTLDLYENWLFRIGEFGSVEENSVMEFNFRTEDIKQRPQVVNFTTEINPVNPDNDYILYGYNDDRWLKHKNIRMDNTFIYLDNNFLSYPTAGWVQVGDADLTYHTEDDLDMGFQENEVQIGNIVWIIQEDNGDWAIKKYLGNYPDSIWLNLRYQTIADMNNIDKTQLSDGQLIYVGKQNVDDFIIVNDYDIRYYDANRMIYDPNNLMNKFETKKGCKIWLVFKFDINRQIFILERVENYRVKADEFRSVYMVNDADDSTIVQMSIWNPIQGVFPDNVLDEIHYRLAIDPVDYTQVNGWGDEYIGRLWWDLSKVRYIDYEQGSLKYRRDNWGKQAVGSEIAIMEWTKSQELPEDITNYITKEKFNTRLNTNETWYYYWVKNPTTFPSKPFRTRSAYSISEIMSHPDELGATYFSPIKMDKNGDEYVSSFIINNFDTPMAGQDVVIQLNFRVDDKIDNHKEWIMIRENSTDAIDNRLWQKMIDSLICEDRSGEIVPDPDLTEDERYGIDIRPRQTMFSNIYEARRNFVEIINHLFGHRNLDISIDITDPTFQEIFNKKDLPPETDVEVEVRTDLDYISDDDLIGKTFLVKSDETFSGRWTIYTYEGNDVYTMTDYQKYNVQDFWKYADIFAEGYSRDTPVVRAFDSELDFMEVWNQLNLKIGDVITFVDGDGNIVWKVYASGGVFNTVGIENGCIQLNSRFYDYLESMEGQIDTYEYIDQEVKTVIPLILSYFTA